MCSVHATVLLAVALLCYRVLVPFLPLAIWALIFAVTLYPLHLRITAYLGGRRGLAATLRALLGIALLVVPIALLMSSLGDSIRTLIEAVQQNTLQIPAPPEAVAAWSVIGGKLHTVWSQAHDDLPALVQSMQPKIGDLTRAALGFVAGIVGGLLAFLAALVLAGILMAFGDAGARACLSVFQRLAGEQNGVRLARLSTATIRAVAQGVVGVALIQAILVGLALLVAGVPWAGALARGLVLFRHRAKLISGFVADLCHLLPGSTKPSELTRPDRRPDRSAKMLKRSMYGRAGAELLRARVLPL
jgi:predicted PurR-regulated permease PerM